MVAAAAVAMAVAALQLSAFLAAAGVDCLLQFGGTQCEWTFSSPCFSVLLLVFFIIIDLLRPTAAVFIRFLLFSCDPYVCVCVCICVIFFVINTKWRVLFFSVFANSGSVLLQLLSYYDWFFFFRTFARGLSETWWKCAHFKHHHRRIRLFYTLLMQIDVFCGFWSRFFFCLSCLNTKWERSWLATRENKYPSLVRAVKLCGSAFCYPLNTLVQLFYIAFLLLFLFRG